MQSATFDPVLIILAAILTPLFDAAAVMQIAVHQSTSEEEKDFEELFSEFMKKYPYTRRYKWLAAVSFIMILVSVFRSDPILILYFVSATAYMGYFVVMFWTRVRNIGGK